MGLFKRFRKNDEADLPDTPDDADAAAVDVTEDSAPADASSDAVAATEVDDDDDEFAKEAPLDRLSEGPWDASEDADDQLNRLDLGALQIPVLDGMQVQLEAEEESGAVMAVSLIHGDGSMQLQAFAAPKTEGLWREVRSQISQSIGEAGGEVQEVYGNVGNELIVKIPGTAPDGRSGFRPARFIGVDGPRWFLRGVLGGDAALKDEDRATFVEIFRGVIVNRGTDAMPPRQALTITPPNFEADEPQADAADDIDPFERGPEITEVR